jgi:hypothetical protein
MRADAATMPALDISMKNGPNVVPASPAPPPRLNSVLRFWACFILSLAILGIISGLMLTGFFLLMGYHVF